MFLGEGDDDGDDNNVIFTICSCPALVLRRDHVSACDTFPQKKNPKGRRTVCSTSLVCFYHKCVKETVGLTSSLVSCRLYLIYCVSHCESTMISVY